MKAEQNDPCPFQSGNTYEYPVTQPILLLFGAGASLGSGGIINCPPSGKNLFVKLCEAYPKTWGQISGQYANNFRSIDFEHGMLELDNKPPQPYNMNDLLSDMGLYFSQFRIDNVNDNLYFCLFRKYRQEILNGKIVLATLNYECIIEYAMTSLDIRVDYFNDGIGVKLLKLHGSCNFVAKGIFVGKGKKALICPSINADLKSIQPEKAEEELSRNGLMPAMSLYAAGKENKVCKEQILSIQKNFQKIAQVSKTIIVIGVRPNADDRHVWDHVKQSPAEVILISGREECQGWIKQPNWKLIGEKFAMSFSDLCDHIDDSLR